MYINSTVILSNFSVTINVGNAEPPGRGGSLLLVLLAQMKSIVYGNLGAKPLLSVLVAVND